MLKINGAENEYTLDLNEYPMDEHILNVESHGIDGKLLSWGIEFKTNPEISTKKLGMDKLAIYVPVERMKDDCLIVLTNYAKERILVTVKANYEASADKIYSFKITKKEIDGKKARIKILSKVKVVITKPIEEERNYELPWKVTYDGKPMEYVISPMSSDKSSFLDIELKSELYGQFDSVIEFTQSKSGDKISLGLSQDNEKMWFREKD